MADERMAVFDLLRKAGADGDTDFLREGVRILAEADGGRGDRADRDPPWRAGTRPPAHEPQRVPDRRWDTRVGTIDLAIPKVRDGSYFPRWVEARSDCRCIREEEYTMRFLDRGPKMDSKSLVEFAKQGDVEAIRRAVEADSSVTSRVDSEGMTLLHWVAAMGNADIAAMLLDAGAAVEAPASRDGWSPLHLAALAGRAKMAALLVKRGASIDTRDRLGTTPLEIARRENQRQRGSCRSRRRVRGRGSRPQISVRRKARLPVSAKTGQ